MSIAQLLQPELNKNTHLIHTTAHGAFSLDRNFPHGELLFEESQYGMIVQGAMQYQDNSCLVYVRDPEEDHGYYFIESANAEEHHC